MSHTGESKGGDIKQILFSDSKFRSIREAGFSMLLLSILTYVSMVVYKLYGGIFQ